MKIREGVLTIVLLLIFAFSLHIFDVSCIVRRMFGIPCPSCGMMRALLSLVKFDFHSYLHYNCFGFPVFCAVLLLLFSKYLPQCFFILAIFILCLNVAYYIYRFSCHAIP